MAMRRSSSPLYLAEILELHSRKVVGHAAEHADQLITDALRMVWFSRQPAPGLILHSDRGRASWNQRRHRLSRIEHDAHLPSDKNQPRE